MHTAYRVSDSEAFQTARQLLQVEGVLAGSSTGTLLSAALRYCRAQSRPKRVVTFACDSGNKYLSKMFNDDWMRQQGLIAGPNRAISVILSPCAMTKRHRHGRAGRHPGRSLYPHAAV
ncbi:cystathionine beta-synthase [Klebsiella aerogenes]|nr:cystathionine beta-synthase [Klebsiella aerogenes]